MRERNIEEVDKFNIKLREVIFALDNCEEIICIDIIKAYVLVDLFERYIVGPSCTVHFYCVNNNSCISKDCRASINYFKGILKNLHQVGYRFDKPLIELQAVEKVINQHLETLINLDLFLAEHLQQVAVGLISEGTRQVIFGEPYYYIHFKPSVVTSNLNRHRGAGQ